MNAVSVYVSAAKLVLQSTASTSAAAVCSNTDLPRLLLSLRQLLSCVVCTRLVNDPYVPLHGQCSHNVCRLCVRGQKNLHPACGNCKDTNDFKSYDENKQMRCLLMCYKSLCEHLRCSHVFVQLAGHKLIQYSSATPTILVPQMSLQDLVVEGASYDDVLSSFSNDLPKHVHIPAKNPQLPALVTPLTSTSAVTPLAPLQQTIKNTGGVYHTSAPKASTPPTTVTGHVSKPLSTYAPKLMVDTSAHLHFKPQTQQQQQHQTSIPNAPQPAPVPPPPPITTQQPTLTTTPHPQLIQLNQLKNAGNITYIGPNTRGIVLPIVSSSGTTTVPLSIASARLQTLNRQLAQARALAVSSASSTASTPSTAISITTSAVESRPPLTTFKVSMPSSHPLKTVPILSCTSSSSSSTSTATASTISQIRNAHPIKTVSNGSAMYSVLYTGIGNKITIKRKTDGDEDASQKKNISVSTSNSSQLRPLAKTPNKKRGCRCGNTTATPGKLTCCGQRCPCYVDSKSCIGCKCRGCRNPHRPDGNKVRPVIPELACYEIQMADDHANMNELPIATTSNALNVSSGDTAAGMVVSATNLSSLNLNAAAATSQPTTMASVVTSTSNATLIPIRNIHHYTASSSSSCSITSAMPPLTSSTIPTQTTSITHASLGPLSAPSSSSSSSSCLASSTAPGSIVQLDQIQRESLLIQNAEGKFQVVNVFTTGGGGQSSNQVPTLQRIQSLPQTIVSAHNSFILPSSISTSSISGTTTTTSLPQIILQSQQQHQQQHQPQQQQQHHQIFPHHHQQQQTHHQSLNTQRITSNVTATSSLPLQLQQQLKQNIITVHTINTNPAANTSPATASTLTPSSSPAPTTATISLPQAMTNNAHYETATSLGLSESSAICRNTYTNMIVSSSASSALSSVNTTTSMSSSLPLSISLTGTVHNQSLNRKTLNSPNV